MAEDVLEKGRAASMYVYQKVMWVIPSWLIHECGPSEHGNRGTAVIEPWIYSGPAQTLAQDRHARLSLTP
jgi:hypothetical protein